MIFFLDSRYIHIYIYILAALMAQMVKNLPTIQETWVWSLGQQDSLENCLENSMEGYSPWGCRVGHNWANNTFTCIHINTHTYNLHQPTQKSTQIYNKNRQLKLAMFKCMFTTIHPLSKAPNLGVNLDFFFPSYCIPISNSSAGVFHSTSKI